MIHAKPLAGVVFDGEPGAAGGALIAVRAAAPPLVMQGDDRRRWPRLSFRCDKGERVALRAAQPGLAAEILHLIARRRAAMAGTVCLDGRDIWLLPAGEIRQKLAFVDMTEVPDPEVSLWQTVARALLPEGCDWGGLRDERSREAISAALAHMGLLSRSAEACGDLDAAGRFSLLIARALATGAALVLIDATPMRGEVAVLDRLARAAGLTAVVALPEAMPVGPWATRSVDLAPAGRVVGDLAGAA